MSTTATCSAIRDGTDYWLADGFHRAQAGLRAGWIGIDADVRQGDRRDAILFSVGANAAHGHRRSNADKRRAVETLLNDSEWAKWSDSKISDVCGVGYSLVADVRKAIYPIRVDAPKPPRTAERNGKQYTVDTSRIGKSRPSAPVEREDRRAEVTDAECGGFVVEASA
jgi:hypothetical protein